MYHPDGETFQLHQLILDNLKERCRKYGDTSTWDINIVILYKEGLQEIGNTRSTINISLHNSSKTMDIRQIMEINKFIINNKVLGIIQGANNNNTLDITKEIWESKETLDIMAKNSWIQKMKGRI
uniref:Uncharacterized protein n=1 Tax=Meloidogyne enterolobii TaxID=390850 RepID=A0A6V7VME1_MELEN|nr:unnamed protein product [Meloidogyne enterolobii]